MSRLTELLGCEHPIIQGAMGIVSTPELVAAVSEAGGYGLLATIFTSDEGALRDEIQRTKALTSNPFGANLFAMNERNEAFIRVLGEEGVRTVTLSGGSPKGLAPLLRDCEIKFICVASTVRAAVGAQKAGAAAVVAEGSESGGVQGYSTPTTIVLVPQVVDAVEIPVIAAGGIGDRRGYRASLALGAEGVQIGTRFIATKECRAADKCKEALVASDDMGTEVLDLGRFGMRALKTPLAMDMAAGGEPPPDFFTPQALEKLWIKGELERSLMPAGQISGMIQDLPSVAEVIAEMIG